MTTRAIVGTVTLPHHGASTRMPCERALVHKFRFWYWLWGNYVSVETDD